MLKIFLKRAFLLVCIVVWFFILSGITVPSALIGDLKLWGGLLSIVLGFSVWARFSLKSKVVQDAYDALFKVTLFYACLYAFYRIASFVILEKLLNIILFPIAFLGLVFPFLIWSIIHTQVAPILIAHGKVEQAKRYIARLQQLFPRSIALAMQKIRLANQEHDDHTMLEEMDRIISLYPRPNPLIPLTSQFGLWRLYHERLRLYLMLGTGEKALAEARFLVSMRYELDLAFIYRGAAFMLIGDYDAAAADLEEGEKRTSTPQRKIMAKILLGMVEYISDNDEQAEAYWSWAMQNLKDCSTEEKQRYSAEIYVSRGLLAFHRADTGKAWQAYDLALRSDRHSVEARAGMAILHAADDHWGQALKIWHRLLTEYPYFADPEDVIRRHFRWTPPMAEGVREITAQLQGHMHIPFNKENLVALSSTPEMVNSTVK